MKNLKKKTIYIIVGLVLFIGILRLSAPYAVKYGVNHAIETTEGISGQIGDVDLHLYRGAYEIENIELFTQEKEKSLPLIKISRLDLSILWSALLDGEVVAELVFYDSVISINSAPEKEVIENAAAKDEDTWIELANKLTPFAIDRLELVNGTLEFNTIDKDEKTARFYMSEMQGTVKNITNSMSLSDTLMSKLDFDVKIMGEAKAKLSGGYNPFEPSPTFDFDLSMNRLPVKYIDKLVQYYTPVDFEAGEIDAALELVSEKGELNGYVKIGVHDLDIFKWREDVEVDEDNPIEMLFEGLMGGITELLENDDSELVATKIPITGNLNDVETPIFPAIVGIFKNAFIEAYEIDIEDLLSFEKIKKLSDSEEGNNKDAAKD